MCLRSDRWREKEREKKERDICQADHPCRAALHVIPMVTIEHVSMLLLEKRERNRRKRGNEWFLHPNFNIIYRDG
jgi:hypothetical protein